MTSIADGSVIIQTSSESVPSMPSCFGEVVLNGYVSSQARSPDEDQRAHARLCWQERLARNARLPATGQVTITLFGVPDVFATLLGLRAP